jgi:hypothetical protein
MPPERDRQRPVDGNSHQSIHAAEQRGSRNVRNINRPGEQQERHPSRRSERHDPSPPGHQSQEQHGGDHRPIFPRRAAMTNLLLFVRSGYARLDQTRQTPQRTRTAPGTPSPSVADVIDPHTQGDDHGAEQDKSNAGPHALRSTGRQPGVTLFALCGGACRKAFVKLHHPGEGAVRSELDDPPEWAVSSIKRLA